MKIYKDKKPLDKLYARRNRFELQPDFQRSKVWSLDKERKLLDTIYKGWDIPKVYLNVIDDENYEVIDGQQRLSAIFKFYDNSLTLPIYTNEIAGLKYYQLEDKVKDKFDDYEIDFVLINDALEEEIRELFLRLQLSVPTNTAERLNAIPGKMTKFVKKLMNNRFFKEKIILKNNRLSHFAVAAQVALLNNDGIRTIKYKDLNDFFDNNKNFNENSKMAKSIRKLLAEADKIFPLKTHAFRNRALIISFFVLLKTLLDNGLKLKEQNRQTLRTFYLDFYSKLQNEIEKGANASDAELIIFQSKVNQDADSKDSIQIRQNIIARRLVVFDEYYKDFLKIKEFDEEYSKLKVLKDTKSLTDDCLEKIASVNKEYSLKNGGDLFKLTNEFLSSLPKIGNVIQNKTDYKNFIDGLYKTIYEGSGSLSRIPKNLIKDDSLWMEIKHLRTDLFHDIEHGDIANIKKKQKVISNIYLKYCQKKSLSSLKINDLNIIQSKLLLELNNNLQILLLDI